MLERLDLYQYCLKAFNYERSVLTKWFFKCIKVGSVIDNDMRFTTCLKPTQV